ncbi:MAG: undecaprenyl-diphosphate phosphatase [Candidatus Nomurabacteria bacterium]|jgi:undecaprenyl-diphosphatase|nr:undecaprenyl-diphosphate phosphatase [Candidatus Nomurabacteria bacterium]
MTLIENLVLGLTQGLTEFIPVSSSGHEVLLQNLFSGASDHLFLEFINIGTLLALLVFFRSKIWQILVDIFKTHDFRLARNLIITSVPAGLAGFLLSGLISENAFFGSSVTVMVALASVGLVMILLEKLPRASQVKTGEELSPWRALAIGLAQTVALVPGVSRSGSTIIAGRLSGLGAKEAAEYSFLASIPIMLGVTAKLFISSSDRAYFSDNLIALSLSNIVAFLAGLFAIGFLLKYLSRHDLKVFGWYRIALAAVVLLVVIL